MKKHYYIFKESTNLAWASKPTKENYFQINIFFGSNSMVFGECIFARYKKKQLARATLCGKWIS